MSAMAASAATGQAEGAPRTWVREIRPSAQVTEICPAYCTDHHTNDQSGDLDDLTHGFYFDGPKFPVFDATEGSASVPVLGGRLQICPYSSDPKQRAPHLNFEPFQDEVMEHLDPEEFAEVIRMIRAQCDQLDAIHRQFVEIHAEWKEAHA
ncbi:DUF6907 domain-containing protein [Streptomyces netropsis]|uniref:DUF6907 domain-containing protein n=1 Tax=Streptomyces netropsis TaxID=55404 RepID=UPI003795F68A